MAFVPQEVYTRFHSKLLAVSIRLQAELGIDAYSRSAILKRLTRRFRVLIRAVDDGLSVRHH